MYSPWLKMAHGNLLLLNCTDDNFFNEPFMQIYYTKVPGLDKIFYPVKFPHNIIWYHVLLVV